MSGALLMALQRLGDWLLMGPLNRIAALLTLVCGAAVVYFAACYLFGLRVGDIAHATLGVRRMRLYRKLASLETATSRNAP